MTNLFLLGFISLGYQIVILREFLVVFSDNEITIGIFLASWMMMSGLGSYLAGFFINRLGSAKKIFSYLLLLIAFLMPIGIILIRIIKPFLQRIPTEILGIGPTMLISLLIAMLFSIFFGIWFVIAVKMAFITNNNHVGRYYAFEVFGTVFGGLLVSIIFIRFFNTIQISLFFSFLIFLLLFLNFSKKYIFLLILVVACIWNSNTIEKLSIIYQWKPFDIAESKDSVYGRITVIRSGAEHDFYENSNKITATELLSNNEEIIHFPLLLIKKPKDVLIIGGAYNNIAEVLKYKVNSVVYLQPNSVFLQLLEKYSNDETKKLLRDPRLEVLKIDSRFFLKRTKRKFDCIIADVPAPLTGFANRHFTIEFFKEIKETLSENGIFIFPLLSSENYMNDELKLLSASIYNTLNPVFTNVSIVIGSKNYFMCSEKKLNINYKYLLREIRIRQINIKYFTRYYLRYILRADRTKKVNEWITEKISEVPINYDFYPICYYYGLNYWTSIFGTESFRKIFKIFEKNRLLTIISFSAIVSIILIKFKKFYWQTVLLVISFISILAEFLIIFAFQSVYGYVYSKIGILLALCLFGIGMGSYLSDKYIAKSANIFRMTKIIIFLNLIYIILLPFLFRFILKNPFYTVSIFYLLIFIAGVYVGVLFPLVVKGYGIVNEQQIGKFYAIDLFGAMLGTILVSLIFIPIFGIINSCYLAAGILFLLLVRSCL
ncbi:MAG: hypothetical protein A2474_02850 [Elusimicrobia bacterium RIFOXYC2_FULL_34_12]|nr:MAG: hypothetical protein A2474_02850 [Elusimicrobia bacterium RIFOXYC2_FULL_34_12]OGS38892.1 MAG: hypothetical protein A2551_03460 [Elusimicrobia bacterium RIFOXYD2_FULL_34_30]HAM39006.1 hypothetical protein [Elusimicrobiota bacterium]